MDEKRPLRIAILHPDLGIGGAERLIVDAALGLQDMGHDVTIYTSHHDPKHCFEETRDGTLGVKHIVSPFPRSFQGRFHILFAILRQLHLVVMLLLSFLMNNPLPDVFLVDQLSACVPILRFTTSKRVVFYCHFPDKLLAHGKVAVVKDGAKDSTAEKPQELSFQEKLKLIYRIPVDWLEESTTGQSDIILANSLFTSRVFEQSFPSIRTKPLVVYPGINISAYESPGDSPSPEVELISSDRPTLVSLNRFERKKNAELAIRSFAALLASLTQEERTTHGLNQIRLVLAGGYDPRLQDNIHTLTHLRTLCTTLSLTHTVLSPHPADVPLSTLVVPPPEHPQVVFLLNFTMQQRTALLRSPHTLALLYTPTNEHFGIGPVEGMICGLPVLACDSGGPMESVADVGADDGEGGGNGAASGIDDIGGAAVRVRTGTGWLRTPTVDAWTSALRAIVSLSPIERRELAERAERRAREMFSMDVMCESLEEVLLDAVDMGDVPFPRGAFIVMSSLGVALAAVVVYAPVWIWRSVA